MFFLCLPDMCSLFQGGYVSVNLCCVATPQNLVAWNNYHYITHRFRGAATWVGDKLGGSWVRLTWGHSSVVVIWIIQNGLTCISSCCYRLSAGPHSACLPILKEAGPSFLRVISNIPRRQGPLHCHSPSVYVCYIFCYPAGQSKSQGQI